MKRKILCFFSFLLVLIVFFTLVSPEIEDEMITLVEIKKGTTSNDKRFRVGMIALNWKNTEDTLFIAVDGKGWEEGKRVSMIPPEYYERMEGHVEFGPGSKFWFVYSASRTPVLGEPIRVIETKRGDDTYLVWHPESLEGLDNLSNTMEILAQTDNAALISTWSTVFPFFEHSIWYRFHNSATDELRIFSLHDVQQFADALPWVAGVIAILLCSLILWSANWLLSGKKGYSKGVWITNILVVTALFAIVPWLLRQFDLPASLMPPVYIMDIAHYVRTFRQITSALNALGGADVQKSLSQAWTVSAAILGASILFAGIIILIERRLFRSRRKQE